MGFTLFEHCSHELHMTSVKQLLPKLMDGSTLFDVPWFGSLVSPVLGGFCSLVRVAMSVPGPAGNLWVSRPIPNAVPIRGISGIYSGSGSSILRRKQKRSNGPGEPCCQEARSGTGPCEADLSETRKDATCNVWFGPGDQHEMSY